MLSRNFYSAIIEVQKTFSGHQNHFSNHKPSDKTYPSRQKRSLAYTATTSVVIEVLNSLQIYIWVLFKLQQCISKPLYFQGSLCIYLILYTTHDAFSFTSLN